MNLIIFFIVTLLSLICNKSVCLSTTVSSVDTASEQQVTETTIEAMTESITESTPEPTEEPTIEPTTELFAEPTSEKMSSQITKEPTQIPTKPTTKIPITQSTEKPTKQPTIIPTKQETKKPTKPPTQKPAKLPQQQSIQQPITIQTELNIEPMIEPTMEQNTEPTNEPTTKFSTDIEETTAKPTILQNKTVSPTPPSPLIKPYQQPYWMMKMGEIRNDLLRIQAMIVKDEEIDTTCNEGRQKATKRFLMCTGSILNRNSIMTSASCLHETLHIRHNVRGPLSVVIAPLRSSVQVIRVSEYKIHPRHSVNPKSIYHATHNVAILSLSCRITEQNYYKIELPTKPYTYYCSEWDCFVARIIKTGHSSNVISQASPPSANWAKQNQIVVSRGANRNIRTLKNNFYKFTNTNESVKSMTKRSVDGTNGCLHTGSAVMVNNTQTGIVATSCDDRQYNNAEWAYTDVFKNLGWINLMLTNWDATGFSSINNDSRSTPNTSTTNSKSCGNCVFNFYINVGCKEKGNCSRGVRKNLNSPSTGKPLTRLQTRFQPNLPLSPPRPVPWGSKLSRANPILRPLRNSLRCPNNSPECITSQNQPNVTRKIIPIQLIRPGMDLASRKIVNDPIGQMTRLGKYKMIYRKNDELKNSDNRTWVLRKPARPMITNNPNMYVLKNPMNQKIINRDMGNWLRRRHANSYPYPIPTNHKIVAANNTDYSL